MNTTTLCHDDHLRRERVRDRPGWNGLDYLEVGDDHGQRTLTVYFLGKAPEQFQKQANETAEAYARRLRGYIRLEGGRRIRDIHVTGVEVERAERADEDDRLIVIVDKSGDFSTYTLRLVDVQDIDPRYDQLDFTFKASCPSDLDCAPIPCPPTPLVEPEINYLAKDYASFRQLILDRLALVMPEWKERHVPDIGIALVEVLAYVGDHLSYYQDAVGTEAYLDTARQRISVRRHARLVDYAMHEGCNARAWVCVEVEGDPTLDPNDVQFLTGPNDAVPGTVTLIRPEQLRNVPTHAYEVFEPVSRSGDIRLYTAHNRIEFYTWGERECCLPRGATSATLRDEYIEPEPPQKPEPYEQTAQVQKPKQVTDPTPGRERKLHLKVGDILIFEEVHGPKTGDKADADPAHRHAVRLTSVTSKVKVNGHEPGAREEELTDPLTGQPIVEIEWAAEDALPFPVCLSAITDSEHGCKYIENISVACGNVILVDHGQTVAEPLGAVPTESTQAVCECEGQPGEVRRIPGLFRPVLTRTPLTFSVPHSADAPAAHQLAQDPRQAYPQAWLKGGYEQDSANPKVPPCVRPQFEKFEIVSEWAPRLDLLESGADDFHFVVEIGDEGHAHIRFGDGELGRHPEAETEFRAIYRVGNGAWGNAGAEAIRHLTYCQTKPDGILSVRNPLPARGGANPEPVAEVKLFAPAAFRKQLQRAITAEDYAALARRDFPTKVQRAAAALRWNGSWYEAQVAVDQFGRVEAEPSLLREVEARLYRYRRIGHDLRVQSARLAPLEIQLTLCVRPDYLRGHVKAALLDVFSNRTLTGGKRGLFHPDNLTFGESIYLSKLVAAAMAVPGVESATVTRLQRFGEPPNREIENGVLPLGPLEVAQVDNDPSFPEHGRLELVMGGGR